MATFVINPKICFNYGYGEEDGKQFTEGEFLSRSDHSSFDVSMKVSRQTREEAIDAIHRYAKLIGNDIA